MGKLGGVRQQVEQGLAQLGQVLVGAAEVLIALDQKLVAVLSHQWLGGGAHFIDQPVQIDLFSEGFHLAGFNLGQIEDIINERQQVGAGLVDFFQVRDEVFLFLVLSFFYQHLAVTKDGVHRRAQLVTHVSEKCALGLVGRIGGIPRHADFFCRLALLLGEIFHLDHTRLENLDRSGHFANLIAGIAHFDLDVCITTGQLLHRVSHRADLS